MIDEVSSLQLIDSDGTGIADTEPIYNLPPRKISIKHNLTYLLDVKDEIPLAELTLSFQETALNSPTCRL